MKLNLKMKIMNFKKIFFVPIFCLMLLNCSYSGGDDLIEIADPNSNTPITYSSDIKTIIDTNCIFCHSNPPSNGAPMSLTTYTNVRDAIENRNLINRISRQDGEQGAMPAGGPRLPQTLIDQIQKWKDDGYLEN